MEIVGDGRQEGLLRQIQVLTWCILDIYSFKNRQMNCNTTEM